jgi:hypothetical protein
MDLIRLKEHLYKTMKSLQSPSSAQTLKTFKSGGKIKLPSILGKREDMFLSWSLKGFEKVSLSCPLKSSQNIFSFPPVKVNRSHLKKIHLKKAIINAVTDEMNSVQKLISVKSENAHNNKLKATIEPDCSVQTKHLSKMTDYHGASTIKKTFTFEFDEVNLVMMKSQTFISKIKKKIIACSKVSSKKIKCGMNYESNSMKSFYKDFQKQNINNLNLFLNEHLIKNKPDELNHFIMKFLLDIVTESDVKNLCFNDILILEKFFIDRYFKLLRCKILDKLNETKIFQSFLDSLRIKFKNVKMEFSISDMNALLYVKYKEIWNSKKSSPNSKFNIFNCHFEKLFSKSILNEAKLFDFLKSFYFEINHVISFLIIKLISERFLNIGFIFNEIELIQNDVTSIMTSIIKLLENLNVKSNSNSKKRLCFQRITALLGSSLEFSDNKMYYVIIQYIKRREMREYMGRKRKSLFVKPRRNDEKLKKIYKRLMKSLFVNFKQEFLGLQKKKVNNFQKKPLNLNDIKFEEFLQEENSKLFISDSEDDESFFNFKIEPLISENKDPSNDKITVKICNMMQGFDNDTEKKVFSLKNHTDLKRTQFKNKSKRFTSKEREHEFYVHYFKERAQELNIPLNNFYDPLKQKFKNMAYKSFTIKYFKLLLSSDHFKSKVKNYLENNRLIIDMLGEYSCQLKDLLKSVPTILIDQHKPKSKFLWTSYEFYFAMYFFKDKFKL